MDGFTTIETACDLSMGELAPERLGHVLIVDDNPIAVESMRQALQSGFAVDAADSGEACLERLRAGPALPDLILLDIEMGGIDGYETCRQLRAQHDMPVIFVSSHDDLPERIKAFDSGGDDFVVKPFDPEVLQRKAARVVEHYAAARRLATEKESLASMAMGFLRSIGDTGVLLTFMRSSLGLADYETLAQRLLDATTEYGVRCHIQVRHADGCHTVTPSGPASPLEESVIERSAGMGRIFQFSRRVVVNYNSVSILIMDLPADEDEAGKIRDNVAILAESAEAIAETIAMRKESALRAEALQDGVNSTADAVEGLRERYSQQQGDIRQRLHDMIDDIERAYVNLGLTDGQEKRVSNILREGVDNTLTLFDVGAELDDQFVQLLDALRPKGQASQQIEIW